MQEKKKPVRRKKRKEKLTMLFSINLLIWSVAAFLWLSLNDPAPFVASRFDQTVDVSMRPDHQQVSFAASGAFTMADVDLTMYSHSALLINLSTREVLFAENPTRQAYPASITKILTAIVAIENFSEAYMDVEADFEGLYVAGAAVAGFAPGERRSFRDVLFGAMLPSGADATDTLAFNVSGSYEAFVALMNETARQIGMNDSHFVNASGLHDPRHYTTAYDIALLLDYALQNPLFREVFTARSHAYITSNGAQAAMVSTLHQNLDWHNMTTELNHGTLLGGKDGFTLPAGNTLASLATDGIYEYILVTFGADHQIIGSHVLDAKTIYNYFLRD